MLDKLLFVTNRYNETISFFIWGVYKTASASGMKRQKIVGRMGKRKMRFSTTMNLDVKHNARKGRDLRTKTRSNGTKTKLFPLNKP